MYTHIYIYIYIHIIYIYIWRAWFKRNGWSGQSYSSLAWPKLSGLLANTQITLSKPDLTQLLQLRWSVKSGSQFLGTSGLRALLSERLRRGNMLGQARAAMIFLTLSMIYIYIYIYIYIIHRWLRPAPQSPSLIPRFKFPSNLTPDNSPVVHPSSIMLYHIQMLHV